MNDKSFVQWLKEPVEGVKPIPIAIGAGIGIACAIVDFFIPFVLIIAAFCFIKKGHKAMGAFLVALNFLPDDLPCIDEVIGLVINIVPLWKQYKKLMVAVGTAAGAMPKQISEKSGSSGNPPQIGNHE